MSKIIGICGFMGSGKDTIADYLEALEGRSKQSREWREQVDQWWAKRLDMPNLTPRWVLQYWGTDVVRKKFHNDMWIAGLENRLENATDDIVITDCRFPNELKAIRKAGGICISVSRGPKPV